MKFLYLIFVLVASVGFLSAQTDRLERCGTSQLDFERTVSDTLPDTINGKPVYTMVDESAMYPGGFGELKHYLADNLKMPSGMIEPGCWRWYLRFIVWENGSISNIEVVKSYAECLACDQEVVRFVSSMSRWIPAKLNGKPVNSYFNLPFYITMRE